MEAKKKLLKDIQELWHSKNIKNFDIAPEVLEYLEEKELKELKSKILKSMSELSKAQKDWLLQFSKFK